MNIVFRVDSSLIIGTGHVMRCLTLAKILQKEQKTKIFFITRQNDGSINELIEKENFRLITLSNSHSSKDSANYIPWLGATQDEDAYQTLSALAAEKIEVADILIVDHYSLDICWERKLKSKIKKLMVIDDLANREHVCDILLDQNLAPKYETRYDSLVPNNCKKFLGISYCLIREEFLKYRKIAEPRNELNSLFIFFGGIDKDNATLKLLVALESMIQVFEKVNVVVGKFNPHKLLVEEFCDRYPNVIYLEQVANMAQLMSESDLSIGAGGATTGERIILGLPSIVFSLAENQTKVAEYLDQLGYINFLGGQEEIKYSNLQPILSKYTNTPNALFDVSLDLLNLSDSEIDTLVFELLER